MFGQQRLGLIQVGARLAQQLLGDVEVAAVHVANGVGREADHLPRQGQRLLPSMVLGVEVCARGVSDAGEAVSVQFAAPCQGSQ